MRAVTMPLTFFTVRGSTYTELPLDVFPISCQRDWAAALLAETKIAITRMAGRIDTLCVVTLWFDNRHYGGSIQLDRLCTGLTCGRVVRQPV
jgi:hypothetical protein